LGKSVIDSEGTQTLATAAHDYRYPRSHPEQFAAITRSLLNQWMIVANGTEQHKQRILAVNMCTKLMTLWLKEEERSTVGVIDMSPVKQQNAREIGPRHFLFRVLHLWRSFRDHTAAHEAVQLLQRFHESWETTGDPRLLPTLKAYTMVFAALAKAAASANLPTVAFQKDLETWMNQLLHLSKDAKSFSVEDTTMFWNSYLNLLAKCSPFLPSAPERAEELLLSSRMSPNEKSYAAVLHAWACSPRPDAASRATHVLEQMVDGDVLPDAVCWNICIQAWGLAGEGQNAEDLLWRMHQMYMDGRRSRNSKRKTVPVRPDRASFLAAINGWAKSSQPDRAAVLFERMLQLRQEVARDDLDYSKDLRPTVVEMTAVMDAWARTPNCGPKVEAMLRQMEKACTQGDASVRPSLVTYTIAIRAWVNTNSADALDRANAMLSDMEKLSHDGRTDLAPSTITYATLIRAWAKSNHPDAPERALSLLLHLERCSGTTASDTQPSQQLVQGAVTYSSVLSAFAKRGKAKQAHDLLEAMKHQAALDGSGVRASVKPNATHWSTVIHAYTKSGRIDAGEQANKLLHELEECYERSGEPSLKPTCSTYASVVLAHGTGHGEHAAEAAEAVLWRMVDRLERSKGTFPSSSSSSSSSSSRACLTVPSVEVCNAVIKVWAESGEPPERAESIRKWMDSQVASGNMAVRPDQATFQYLMLAWKRSGRRYASQHIKQIASEMQKNCLDSTGSV
jgi:pentatricopeptide repeat protein